MVLTDNSLHASAPYATHTIPLSGTGVALNTAVVSSSLNPSTYGHSQIEAPWVDSIAAHAEKVAPSCVDAQKQAVRTRRRAETVAVND